MVDLARFHPRLLDTLKGYDRQRFVADLTAGMTVGVIALPLAMAFGIASGVKPEQGILTAIIGGFLVAALGGSNVQIGGPAGAFIVIVYGIVERYGLTNLLISTALAGVLLFAMGALKPGGILLTCSCTGLVSEEQFLDMLRRAAFYAGRTVQVLKITGAGADHPWLAHVPESRYLKAVFCRVD